MAHLIKAASIRIEASSLCQLHCPCCPQTQGVINQPCLPKQNTTILTNKEDFLNPWSMHAAIVRRKPIGLGYLQFNNFKRIIEENPWVKHIELSNWGEMFLNPQLISIIEYAHENKVMLTADNGVNLNDASDNALEALVKYKFISLSCSINGATNETYSRYSIGGNLDKVIENIKKINIYKKKYKSKFPILHWQFVVFGHNEHEIKAAREQAKNLDMYFMLRFNNSNIYSPVQNKNLLQKQILGGVVSRAEYFQKHGLANRQKIICAQLWNAPQINWDGRLLGCCVNYWDDFGNVFDKPLLTALNNEKINYAREMLLGKMPARSDILCSECIYYKFMKDSDRWLSLAEVRFYEMLYWIKYACIRFWGWYPLPPNYCT
ncbi:MAG: SPASM domain-containing protein [Candidatus Omnitrophota bacterium]|nr:SPASM domain-containing protein [Candidatus Omnitrophota bacterium]